MPARRNMAVHLRQLQCPLCSLNGFLISCNALALSHIWHLAFLQFNTRFFLPRDCEWGA
jgi:hypothetical protein